MITATKTQAQANGDTLKAPAAPCLTLESALSRAALTRGSEEGDLAFVQAAPLIVRFAEKHITRNFRQIPAIDREHIAQDCVTKVWRALHTYSGSRPLLNWLGVVVCNATRDFLRSARSRSYMKTNLVSSASSRALGSIVEAECPEEHGPLALAIEAESEASFEALKAKLLSTISPTLRRTAELLLEDSSYPEMAAKQNVPVSTVKGRVRAVRQAALKLCAETAKGS